LIALGSTRVWRVPPAWLALRLLASLPTRCPEELPRVRRHRAAGSRPGISR
jgi:hypothetical protein